MSATRGNPRYAAMRLDRIEAEQIAAMQRGDTDRVLELHRDLCAEVVEADRRGELEAVRLIFADRNHTRQ